ncbi:uncharacterized protein LOC136087634 isoform X1 [Hydra vulgaris]|uniref:Uncharacterized protein LOC136087634 isoform X1 n=1 Tax=Hydra vulgaris TaxID=6087 RepID=A0ABM4CYT5_HYDVU
MEEHFTKSQYSRKDAATLPVKGFPLTESEFQAKVMKYLTKQDQRLENIEKILLNLTSSSVGVAGEISPISNLEELHNLVVLSLSSAGGKDVKDVVKNIMESVATYDLFAKFNFKGTNRLENNKDSRPKKKAFKSLNICKVVCCAAMKDRRFNREDVVNCVKDILRYAPDKATGG